MYDERTTLSRQVAADLRSFFGTQVFASVIPRNVRLAEAPSHGKPIMFYDISSRGAESYMQLAKEVIANDQKRAGPGTGSTDHGNRSRSYNSDQSQPQPQQQRRRRRRWRSSDRSRSGDTPTGSYQVDIDLIDPNPYQPRTRFREEALEELSRSIQSSGIIQPLVLRKMGRALPAHCRRAPLARGATRGIAARACCVARNS